MRLHVFFFYLRSSVEGGLNEVTFTAARPTHTHTQGDRYVYVLCGSGIIITISSS